MESGGFPQAGQFRRQGAPAQQGPYTSPDRRKFVRQASRVNRLNLIFGTGHLKPETGYTFAFVGSRGTAIPVIRTGQDPLSGAYKVGQAVVLSHRPESA